MSLSAKLSKIKVHPLSDKIYDNIMQILQDVLEIKRKTQTLSLTKQFIQKKSKNYKLNLNSKYV